MPGFRSMLAGSVRWQAEALLAAGMHPVLRAILFNSGACGFIGRFTSLFKPRSGPSTF